MSATRLPSKRRPANPVAARSANDTHGVSERRERTAPPAQYRSPESTPSRAAAASISAAPRAPAADWTALPDRYVCRLPDEYPPSGHEPVSVETMSTAAKASPNS